MKLGIGSQPGRRSEQTDQSAPIENNPINLDFKWNGQIGQISPTSEQKPPTPAIEIGDTFKYTGERKFEGRIQIIGLSFPESRYTRLIAKCMESGECSIFDCPFMQGLVIGFGEDAVWCASALATYFDTNNLINAFKVYVEQNKIQCCSKWYKKIKVEGEEERAITRGIICDLKGQEGRAWFIHGAKCDLSKMPNWIIAKGYLCKGAKGRIGVLITEFTVESEVLSPSESEVEKAKEILRSISNDSTNIEDSNVFKIARILQKASHGKGEEIVKGFASDLLFIASPIWTKTPEGNKELSMTCCEIGVTTNFKSQRAKFLINLLGAGKYRSGRITEAGLTAGLEKIEGLGWTIKKGLLPSYDLSFVIVDNINPNILNTQLESRRDGIISITGIKSGELWARTRLKILLNPQKPFEELVFKCTALKIFDHKFIARLCYVIFTYGVSIEERYNPNIEALTEKEKEILNAAVTVLKWNLSREVTFEIKPSPLWNKIMELSKKLEEKYGIEDIPLLLRNIPYKLATLTYCFMLLNGYDKPSEKHVELAYNWLDYCAKDIELDRYVEVQRQIRELSEEEYEEIKSKIERKIENEIQLMGGDIEDSNLYKIITYLMKHQQVQRDELCAYLECGKHTVTEEIKFLKGLGLVKSSRNGYEFTAKGVRFIKKWLNLMVRTERTVQPISQANTQNQLYISWKRRILERLEREGYLNKAVLLNEAVNNDVPMEIHDKVLRDLEAEGRIIVTDVTVYLVDSRLGGEDN